MANLNFKNVTKVYEGGVLAVKDLNLTIEDEEFIVFVGPSGCGKSTTLRMIAGLEDITEGELYIGNILVNDVQPKNRDIAMVFQNYALYPHLNVYDNIAFGLVLRKMPKNEIKIRVEEAAELLGILDLLKRKPRALSGGQKQRVALARAIVRNPQVFLMDEPLSNLDAKLRTQTRSEIINLHKELKTTFVYVTHDQTEAMTMADRIVVMDNALVQQVDTPHNIYENPSNIFVAKFIGNPPMNIFKVTIKRSDNNIILNFADNDIILSVQESQNLLQNDLLTKDVYVGIRPEYLSVCSNPTNNYLNAKVKLVEVLGFEKLIYCTSNGFDIVVKTDKKELPEIDEEIKICINLNELKFFDIATELSLDIKIDSDILS